MASYTRQSTFSDGDLITAALFNDEYNQLLEAFENTTGHKHDGTVGEGPVIGILGDAGVVTPLNKILIDTTNDHIEFWIDVSGTSTQQLYIADGAIVPVTDNDIDLGTSSLQFKDLYINGTANIDSLVADTADINGGTIDGTIIGGTSAAAITGTTITGTSFVIGSASIDETELEILDGATLTTTELNYVDGVTSSIQTQIDTKAPLASPSLTGIPTAPTAASNTNTTQIATTAYVQTEITELIAGAPGTLDTLNELAAAINDDANYNTTLTTALATKLPLAGGTMTGDVTYSDNVKAQFGTSNDLQIYHNGNASFISDVGTGDLFVRASNSLKLQSADGENYLVANANGAVTLYHNNAAKLATTSTGIDITGTITADGLTVDDITINGSTISDGGSITIDTEGDFIVDSEGDVYLDAAGNDWNLNSAGTNVLKVTNTSGDISIKSMTSDKDLIFKGVDGGSTITALTLDMSDAGTAIFNHDIKVGDNSKAIFGAGSDLEIYHDGSNSFIKDSGTGSLLIDATNLYLRNSSGEEYASFISDGAANLKYNGSTRIVTTSAGINVTGIVENDGLRVDNTDSIRPTGDTSLITISGGNATNSGANYSLFGGTHATLANIHRWRIGGSEAARIDASGNLMVGKTTASIATTGVELRPNGQLFATQSANYPLLLNRTTSDGTIIQLRKDNTTVGNIGSFSAAGNSYLTIGSGDTGLLVNSISDALQPWNISTNAGRDAAIDLGATSGRFKDLYLAGTANFGSLSDGTITITGFADEDDMSSNSATLVPTQQSVKAYVDSQVSSAGGTGISFADDEKAKFGDGLDLEIYHDGSSSYIKDVGTGSLFINGSQVVVASSTGEVMFNAVQDAQVILYHNNSAKFQTTSTGIDVTGTATMDGLTVDGVGSLDNNGLNLELSSSNTGIIYDAQNGYHTFKRNGTNALQINGATGDISFYDDTGTSKALYWDASAESLGIGTSSPSSTLEVKGASATSNNGGTVLVTDNASLAADIGGTIALRGTDGSADRTYGLIKAGKKNSTSGSFDGYLSLQTRINGQANTIEAIRIDENQNVGIGTTSPTGKIHIKSGSTPSIAQLIIGYNNTSINYFDANTHIFRNGSSQEKMRLTSAGKLGLGTTSPQNNLHVNAGTGGGVTLEANANVDIDFRYRSGGVNKYNVAYDASAGSLIWYDNTANATRMTLDSSGNLGIGTTSPSSQLNIKGTTGLLVESNGSANYGVYIESNFADTMGTIGALSQADAGRDGASISFNDFGRGIVFKTNEGASNSEAGRFDASGNFMVGTTDTFPGAGDTNTGIALQPSGAAAFSRDGFRVVSINRNTSDGDILEFRKDGSTVGSVGTLGGDLTIGTGDTGLRFNDGINTIIPTNISTNAISNNVVILGHPDYRFRDLYLGGTAYVNTSVGIGTTSPSEDLHISGDTSVALIEGTNTATSGLVAGVKVKAQFYRRAGFSILDESDNEDLFIGRPYGTTIPVLVFNTDGTERMRLTSTGLGIGTTSPTSALDVTGTATMDGLTVEGTATTRPTIGNSDVNTSGLTTGLNFKPISNIGDGAKLNVISGLQPTTPSPYTAGFEFVTHDWNGTTNTQTKALTIGASGDISFYEDTGSTAKLFWDASAESLGIGTTSPSAKLHVSSSGDTIARITSADGNAAFLDLGDASDPDGGRIVYDSGSNLGFSTASTERMRIDSSGRVGIGTSSPSSLLHISSTSPALTIEDSDATSTFNKTELQNASGTFNFNTRQSDGTFVSTDYQILKNASGANIHKWFIGGSEKLRLDASGRLGIGTTSPDAPLTVHSSSDPEIRLGYSSTQDHRITWDSAKLFIDADPDNGVGNSALGFRVDGSEAGRFDASGNFMVGKTSVGVSTTGSEIRSNGQVSIVREGDTPLFVNRKTNDGTVIDLRKDNSTFGKIGNNGDNLGIESVDVGLLFLSGSSQIIPTGGNFGVSDGTKDLGRTTTRFKDLYLSGGHMNGQANALSFISGGNASNAGANILLYGQSHASLANTTIFRASGSEAARIDASGRLGIGTTSMSAPLEVRCDSNNRGISIVEQGVGTETWKLGVNTSGDLIFLDSVDTTASVTFQDGTGNVGIGTTSPTEALHVTGNILASGNVTAYSDERLKENIKTLQGSKVLDMRGVSYTKDGEASSGVIAQEIEKVAPELVHTAKDEMGTKSVAYGNLVGYLIEAIKDQQKQIDDLKERLDNGTS